MNGSLSPRWKSILLPAALTFAATFYIAGFKVLDRDLWWHLKLGEIFVTTGKIPALEPFAYTRAGRPLLTTYEWLAEIILYFIQRYFGFTGLIVFRSLLASITIGFVLFAGRRFLWLNALIAILVLNALRTGLMDRPQLFSYAIFAAMLWLAFRWLSDEQEQRRFRIPLAFIILEILWVNLHGAAAILSFAIVGAMGAQVSWQLITSGTERRSRYAIYSLLVLTGCLIVGLFLSPSGYHNIAYLHTLLTDKTIAFIGEWQPRAWKDYLRSLGPLWALLLLSLFLGRRSLIFSCLVVAAFGYASRLAFRHEMLFAIVAGVVAVHQFDHAAAIGRLSSWLAARRSRAVLLVAAYAAVFTFTFREYYRFALKDNLFGYGVFDLAKGATDFIEREHVAGNMFNTYGIGGYLAYRGYPDRKIYIDGRNVDYGFPFMMESYRAGKDPVVWGSLASRYQLSYALIDYDAITEEQHVPYSDHLTTNPKWALVYVDDWVAVYLKRTAANEPIVTRRELKALTPRYLNGMPKLDSAKSADPKLLEGELVQAVNDSPESVKARLALARMYLASDRPEEALRLVTDALTVQPRRAAAFELLAAYEMRKQDWPAAANAYDHMLRYIGDTYTDINYAAIAKVYRNAGRSMKAWYLERFTGTPPPPEGAPADMHAFEKLKANELKQPEIEGLLAQLGQTHDEAQKLNDDGVDLAQAGKTAEARQLFMQALTLEPRYAEAHNNLGATYEQLGDREKALEAYRHALEVNPDYKDARLNIAWLLYRQGDYEQAKVNAQEALRLGADTAKLMKALESKTK